MENIVFDRIEIAYQFLKSTDWYYVREIETGDSVPEDIVAKRKEAREFIRENEC